MLKSLKLLLCFFFVGYTYQQHIFSCETFLVHDNGKYKFTLVRFNQK